jgi:hypothetical protein
MPQRKTFWFYEISAWSRTGRALYSHRSDLFILEIEIAALHGSIHRSGFGINTGMPRYTVTKIQDALNTREKV